VSGVGEGSSPSIDGVLFDYGETLVEFTRPVDALADAELRILAVLSAEGQRGLSAEGLRAILDRLDREVVEHQRRDSLEEMDLAAASLRAYEDAGLTLDGALLDEVLRIEQEAWWHGAHVDPDTVPLLEVFRGRDIRVGLCSNAPYRAESLHAQLAFLGLDRHLDAVTFSAEVGWRKPAPQIFRAALRALGTGADRTVMVGDSETADISGAHAAGMRAVLLTRHGEHGASEADAEIAALRDLPGALRDMGIYLG
jgi:putative hydrolase of the HAD superfamily